MKDMDNRQQRAIFFLGLVWFVIVSVSLMLLILKIERHNYGRKSEQFENGYDGDGRTVV